MLDELIIVCSLIAFGLIMNFSGYKVFKHYPALLGLFFAILFSINLFTLLKIENVFMVLAVSAIIAILFSVFYKFGIAFAGFTLSYLVTFNLSSDVKFSLTVATLFGLITLILERQMLIFITSSLGSSAVTLTLYIIIKDLKLYQMLNLNYMEMFKEPLLTIFWLCLTINGIITQLIITKDRGEK